MYREMYQRVWMMNMKYSCCNNDECAVRYFVECNVLNRFVYCVLVV
jgi:hypothetical protein